MVQSLAAFAAGIRPIDVKYKIRNFTMKYRKCKAGQGTGCSPATWKHYERVHRIIGNDRINNVDAVVVDSITAMPPTSPISPSCSSLPVDSSPTFSASSSPALSEVSTPATKTKNQKISELNETIKTAMAENNKLTAELIEIEKKKVAAIEILSQSVVSFLERN
ncbi:PREDICTED: uncharacterized protein LOC108361544 isoform X2 [Rhagoletis zephyria]|uniref:uncharacterized protein LOC108361544 isoform X1 n=1 Tax=Rhagoletis zephyria TaxID=28612 RepID=UPI0008118154|nr:PREDICTED: uncharacterized protein LOC108361544 isoform X1 [Rhagoletis zephyria]XP_017469669.1 PREDICTED: uncharacterized protein LOC108361544 isoform X2 [Rhagoletis zephyria]